MRRLFASLLVCGCSADVVIAPGEGGGGGGSATGPTSGSGGQPPTRTIVVDLDTPDGAERDAVVVVVSAPDGAVRATWLGGDLPVEAGVNDGDLVTYFGNGASSNADSFRVTPELTELRIGALPGAPFEPCELATPMTITLELPQVDDGIYFDLRVAGANYLVTTQLHPGSNTAQVVACVTTTSFDLVLVAKESANNDSVAFARLDDIPYVPGGTATLPIELSSERTLVDFVVEAQPGAKFEVRASWYTDAFGFNGMSVDTSMTQTVGDTGSASLSYGPFALGAGLSRVVVSVPPFEDVTCEVDFAWKESPFDGTPLHARIGALAGFAPQADGNVALAADGEVGDVMVRAEDDYASEPFAHWTLHEDPRSPYPLPAKPQVPAGLLPDFRWTGPDAMLRYLHEDRVPTEGYADYARSNPWRADGRTRERLPEGCPERL